MPARPTSGAKRSHIAKSAEVAGASHEELVQTLVASLESSFSPARHDPALEWAGRLFRDLDEATLRGLVYRHGLFEEPMQLDEERPASRDETDE